MLLLDAPGCSPHFIWLAKLSLNLDVTTHAESASDVAETVDVVVAVAAAAEIDEVTVLLAGEL